MGVRLRTTLTATAAVAAALCLAAVALVAALDSSLSDSTRKVAMTDADRQAGQVVCASRTSPPGGAGETGREGRDGNGTAGRAGKTKGPACGTAPSAPPAHRTRPTEHGTAAPAAPAVPQRTLRVTKVVDTGKGPVTVVGRASTEPARAALATVNRLLLPGIPVLLALVALATWLAVGRVLRPVSAIRAKVADITEHDLHERVPVPGTRDEIAALARTVNATLDRLRTAVEAHRRFVADAAHELRSPMAVLRTRLDLAGPDEQRLAQGALDDVDRLQSLSADLLLLARLDAGEPRRAAELDLGQLVAEEAARRRPRADVRVRLDLAADVLVVGSDERLRRLVSNLVDNAVRHASATVAVSLRVGDGLAVLDVADDGPGIPPEHHATVFERFARLDHARARDTGGSGLGLPIARDIARAHGGTLRVVPAGAADERNAAEAYAPGARLRATLPLPGHSGALEPDPEQEQEPRGPAGAGSTHPTASLRSGPALPLGAANSQNRPPS